MTPPRDTGRLVRAVAERAVQRLFNRPTTPESATRGAVSRLVRHPGHTAWLGRKGPEWDELSGIGQSAPQTARRSAPFLSALRLESGSDALIRVAVAGMLGDWPWSRASFKAAASSTSMPIEAGKASKAYRGTTTWRRGPRLPLCCRSGVHTGPVGPSTSR